jgi:Uma2 family endonuclease
MTTRVILTYEDYAVLPDDGRRYELHGGELSVTPAPGLAHQDGLGNLFVVIRQHVKARALGRVFIAPVDCILSDTTVVQPDLVYVDTATLSSVSRRGIEGAPTLAVEVISPSTTTIDRRTKLQLYARHRVPYYWIVDLDARTIEAFHLQAAGYRLAHRMEPGARASLPPFPDLTLEPAEIWP